MAHGMQGISAQAVNKSEDDSEARTPERPAETTEADVAEDCVEPGVESVGSCALLTSDRSRPIPAHLPTSPRFKP